MSFLEDQKAIFRNCAFQSATFIAPGLSVLYVNNEKRAEKITLGSIGYFVSCSIRDEFNYFLGDSHKSIIAGSVFGGFAYADINSYSHLPSVLMSLGYNYAYYLPHIFSIPATIIIEIYTELLNTGDLKEGFKSGVVYGALTIAHDIYNTVSAGYQEPTGLFEEDQCPVA